MSRKREGGAAKSSSIIRENDDIMITIKSGTALSEAIDLTDFASGSIITPSALEVGTYLAFDVSHSASGPFVPMQSSDSDVRRTIAVTVNASKQYMFPDELFGVAFFKIRTVDSVGADKNQTADRVFSLFLKG